MVPTPGRRDRASSPCTITLGDAVERVRAQVKDLKATVVIRA